MGIVVAAVVMVAMFITLVTTGITNVQLLKVVRDNWTQARNASTKSLSTVIGQTMAMFVAIGGWFAAVLAAPFGIRETLLYLVVLPVVSLVFAGVLFVGVRGYRATRRRGPHRSS